MDAEVDAEHSTPSPLARVGEVSEGVAPVGRATQSPTARVDEQHGSSLHVDRESPTNTPICLGLRKQANVKAHLRPTTTVTRFAMRNK